MKKRYLIHPVKKLSHIEVEDDMKSCPSKKFKYCVIYVMNGKKAHCGALINKKPTKSFLMMLRFSSTHLNLYKYIEKVGF
ncbi:hypothetical protein [Acetobacter fabarum]|uniref:hypothetical protein n=1 Tax=Acetobacter fabarum TaxID=483199 RepID=UPI0039E7B51B